MTELIKIKAEKWVNNGLCIGYYQGETYFIAGAIPNEEVKCELVKNTSKLKLLSVREVVFPSEIRVSNDCEIFLKCGGCQFRHISYLEELKVKEDLLRKELYYKKDIKIVSSESENYRNNVQLKTQGNRIGFFQSGSNTLVDFPKYGCKNLSNELNSFILNPKNTTFSKEFKLRLSETGVVDYSKKISMLRIGEYVFEIPINGFFQVNRFLISNWIKEIRSLLPKTKVEFVELFSGCGLISISISDLILKSTCMEIDKKSIEFSKKNSIRNEKKNLKFIQSDLYSSQNNVENFSAKHWIVNPPRNGLGREIFRLFEKCKPELLIYSSCNYVTLARDLKFFFQLGYKITDISLFDFFPRTHYFETLVKIERK